MRFMVLAGELQASTVRTGP